MSERDKKNIKVLLLGWWYSELPPILDSEKMIKNIHKVFHKLRNKEYEHFKMNGDKFICEFKNINAPKYKTMFSPAYNGWSEPISYYTFKKEKNYREMQIPNLTHYVAFIYNSILVFDGIFKELYLNSSNNKYVENSNSYVVLGENFVINVDYDNLVKIEEGIFVSNNNKQTGNYTIITNQERFSKQQKAFLYSIKIDIESFFPNIYSHNFEKIFKYAPYKDMGLKEDYFKFLDTFHQKINNNQTKGIPAGVFSSHVAAELLMLAVDEEIRENIKDSEIGYIRYVDDMTFFSDDKNKLEAVYSKAQKILNKYRLRVNGTKTEFNHNYEKTYSSTNREEIFGLMPYLKSVDEIEFTYGRFQQLKIYISEQLKMGNISQIKTMLTMLKNKIGDKLFKIDNNLLESLYCYLIMLVFENENLTYHIYQFLDNIINIGEDNRFYIGILKQKRKIIDDKYADTLLQIWNYYLITKYMNSAELTKFWNECKDNITNPIIISFFVACGKAQNTKLFKWIMKKYQGEIDNKDEWKNSIMFSKWFLPILRIREVDEYNYYNFMDSTNFPKILRDMVL
ncbi:MAG: RNA-directed DNA polymerase [Bacilli bacterium]